MAFVKPMSPASSHAGGTRHARGSSDTESDADTVISLPQSSANHRLNFASLPGAGVSLLNLARYDSPGAEGISMPRASTSMKGFNAISTVLNHPTKRPQPIDPKSSRYPALPNANAPEFDLPKVRRADYEGYIQSVGKQWGSWKHNREAGTTGTASLTGTSPEGSKGTEGKDIGARTSIEEAAAIATRKRLAPLSAVPQVFFDEDFSLGNPYTFDIVTERYKSGPDGSHAPAATLSSDINSVTSSGYDPALNAMLQEKLSYYSDVIEQHLTLEIRTRSASFFHALTNLQELEAEGKACVEQIEELKKELIAVESGVVRTGLETIRLQDKRRKIRRKLRATTALEETVRKRDLADMMVRQGEYEEALEMIESVETDLQPSIPPLSPLLPLQGRSEEVKPADSSDPPQGDEVELHVLRAMGSVDQQLAQMRDTIGSQIEAEFLSVLELHLRHTTDSSALSNGNVSTELKDRLSPLLLGLSRTHTVKVAVAKSREVDKAAIRERLDLIFDQFAKNELDGKSGSFGLDETVQTFETVATSLRALANVLDSEGAAARSAESSAPAVTLRLFPHEAYTRLSQLLYNSLLGCLNFIDSQNHAIAWTMGTVSRASSDSSTPSIASPMPTTPSGETSISISSTLSDIQSSLVEYVHMLLSRFVHLRGASNIALPLGSYLEVFVPSWLFIESSEELAHRTVMGFRNTSLSQAKAWLSHFHRERIERAARAVEEEMWGQTDVDAQRQRVVSDIVLAATHSPKSFIRSPTLAIPEAQSGPQHEPSVIGEKANNLVIEENTFSVVGACLVVLDMLAEYLQVVLNLPMLATDTMSKITELLKQFNSRTCQVVLGAGAMRSAGLRNITAKHLALASQSLSIMITLIPYVRETVRRHLTPQQAVMLTEFDKMRRDYQEHQYEIHAKLVAIMSDRLTVHCRSLNTVDWNAPTTSSPPEPNKYAADLVKETATLHKVLTRYLQPAVVSAVIGQVLKAIDVRVAAEFADIDVQNQDAKDRLEADKTLLDRKLGVLSGVEWRSENLSETLEKITVPPPAPPPEPKPEAPQSIASPTAPTYKPRIAGLFNRRAQQASGSSTGGGAEPSSLVPTPPNGRASTDSAPSSAVDAQTDQQGAPVNALAVPASEDIAASGPASPPPPTPPLKDAVGFASGIVAASPTQESSHAAQGDDATNSHGGSVSPAAIAASTEDRETTSTDDGPAITATSSSATTTAEGEVADLPPTASTEADALGRGAALSPSRTPPPPAALSPVASPSSYSTDSPTSHDVNSTPSAASSNPPPRMSLRQRLAEAASRRSAAAANAAGNNSALREREDSASGNSASGANEMVTQREENTQPIAVSEEQANPDVPTSYEATPEPEILTSPSAPTAAVSPAQIEGSAAEPSITEGTAGEVTVATPLNASTADALDTSSEAVSAISAAPTAEMTSPPTTAGIERTSLEDPAPEAEINATAAVELDVPDSSPVVPTITRDDQAGADDDHPIELAVDEAVLESAATSTGDRDHPETPTGDVEDHSAKAQGESRDLPISGSEPSSSAEVGDHTDAEPIQAVPEDEPTVLGEDTRPGDADEEEEVPKRMEEAEVPKETGEEEIRVVGPGQMERQADGDD